ncbi:Nrap protein [Venturia nashicola]|uniref:U3 small nucleolar RNA-associated protein 22 n=1 Tax=Venturia nashicola TaxID=86259 RepID=A0A4Z1NFU5_9PEZI|nr:Nrap protein [Venturia nashicola]
MSPPATKRRKLSHSSSDSDSDNDSFASFSSEDPPNGQPKSNDAPGEEMEALEADGDDNGSGNSGEEMDTQAELSVDKTASHEQRVSKSKAAPRKMGDGNGTAYNAEVFKSNLFKLQVDELLEQVRPVHTRKNDSIESAVRTLKTIIEEIPARKPASVGEAQRSLLKKDKVVVPMHLPQDVNYKLEYAKPANFNVVGSHPLKTGTKTGDELILDLMIMMPPNLFERKDYLNHRYFHKRAYYLACLAAGVKSCKEQRYHLSFDYLHGNTLLPILIVELNRTTHPTQTLPCKNLRIVILPSIPDDLFPKEKLLPVKNCIRPKSATEAEPSSLQPTSFYNASIRADSLASSYLKLQNQVSRRCEAYTDACLLGRIWLKQRGFNGRIQGGGLGNFEWSILIALLLEGGGPKGRPAFSLGYSSYQIFKATLQYLAGKDLLKMPHLIGGDSTSLPKNAGLPIVFDGARALNVLFKMTPWSYKLLQHEARATVAMLNDSTFDHFDAAFILRNDQPLCRYDVVVELPSSLGAVDTADNRDDSVSKPCRNLYSVLSRGLSDRITAVCIRLPEDHCWDITSPTFTHSSNSVISIGLILDPANAHKLVDHGPSAEDKKAAALFQKFWGEKAELRRFKDGSILESLVWSSKDGTGSIFRQILTYLLKRHFGEKFASAMNYKGEADTALLTWGSKSEISPNNLFQPVIVAFQKLERDFRGLEDVPLQIRHVLAADTQLSYGSKNVPFVPGRTRMLTPANVVIQFEGSARWPDDLDAIQRTKIAFLLKLAELLDDAVEEVTTRVGLENSDSPLLNQSFLDVIYADGSAFRLRIHHDRESTLLERQLQDKTLPSQEKLETASALAIYKQSFLRQPSHTQAMQTLATRFPVLSPTIRLLKKWFSSHLLSTHFSSSFIDLLAVRAFTNPYPWTAPSSATTGLLRSLIFLARWDWRREPWIVDLSATGDMKPELVSTITTRFEAWRKIDPALNRVVLFAASNVDTDGTTWTDHARPAKVVAARMTALAKAAVAHIKDEDTNLDFGNLFVSSTDEYDVLIKLNPRYVKLGQPTKISNSGYKNLPSTIDNDIVGFHPVRLFIEDLEKCFGVALVLFWNEDGGDVVAGLWNPQMDGRGWKLKLGYSSMPVTKEKDGEVFAYLNKEGIVNEIARLGGELVKAVEMRER